MGPFDVWDRDGFVPSVSRTAGFDEPQEAAKIVVAQRRRPEGPGR